VRTLGIEGISRSQVSRLAAALDEEVAARLAHLVQLLEERFPDMAAMLEEAAADIAAFSTFPTAHWRQIWSNNPEGETQPIRSGAAVTSWASSRTGQASSGSFEPCASEQHDERQVARRYMSVESILESMQPVLTVEEGFDQEVVPHSWPAEARCSRSEQSASYTT
jgi:hypothetical protein